MLIVLEFLIFLIYTSLIFFVKQYYLIITILLINIVLMFATKTNIKKATLFILKIFPFILFTSIFNIIFSDMHNGILIGIRLTLVCNITYIFSCMMTPKKIQFAIEKVLFPLKILNINPKEIGVIVSISISFIPIFQEEIKNLQYSLTAKGFKLSLRSFLKRPNCILVPLFTSVIKRTSEIEQSMISKGYV